MAGAGTTMDTLYARSAAFGALTPPASCIGNTAIKAGSTGDYIDPTKVRQRRAQRLAQNHGTANAAQRVVLAVVHGTTGALVKLYARNTVAAVTTSTTIDIYKNGSTILSATLVLTSAEAATLQSTTGFSSTSLVAGDVLEAVITVSGATPGQGIAVELIYDEDPQ